MDFISNMNSALDYIEAHLTEEIDYCDLAQAAQCSSHTFQRFFTYITGVSLAEYIRRRRLSCAAKIFLQIVFLYIYNGKYRIGLQNCYQSVTINYTDTSFDYCLAVITDRIAKESMVERRPFFYLKYEIPCDTMKV